MKPADRDQLKALLRAVSQKLYLLLASDKRTTSESKLVRADPFPPNLLFVKQREFPGVRGVCI
jgi:hypothetical protein